MCSGCSNWKISWNFAAAFAARVSRPSRPPTRHAGRGRHAAPQRRAGQDHRCRATGAARRARATRHGAAHHRAGHAGDQAPRRIEACARRAGPADAAGIDRSCGHNPGGCRTCRPAGRCSPGRGCRGEAPGDRCCAASRHQVPKPLPITPTTPPAQTAAATPIEDNAPPAAASIGPTPSGPAPPGGPVPEVKKPGDPAALAKKKNPRRNPSSAYVAPSDVIPYSLPGMR